LICALLHSTLAHMHAYIGDEVSVMNERNETIPDQTVTPDRDTYVKPELRAQPLDEVVRAGGGASGDFPGFDGGRP
jgi:hypothetical protein